ncbi:DUF1835 domain-containing protein [Brevibacillus sp. HB1.4B]|uniref:DUF1835 domain-containing protein n=1 Tax=Brevibacillus sp. HB1.4B TaxID=2738845 RepID=UPI00156AD646|nr:DUF1835 domain-containing protein [Brevibacillus sp. HB1.4B]NRS16304.1 DUF1835 domain-containing protein [Brevibacillus sp. HB1.4B]
MNKFHICFSLSAYGTLRSVFRKQNLLQTESIICIEDDFSVGPLHQLETATGMNERIEWIHSFFKQVEPISNEDLTTIKAYLLRNLTLPSQVPDGSSVILWYGQNASDSIGIRYVVSMLQDKNLSFEGIDITAFSVNCDYKVRNIDGNEVSYVLKSAGALPPKLVVDAYQVKKNMPAPLVQSLILEWEKWSQSDSTLRVYKQGEVLEVSEDYYDALLLEHASNKFQKAARVIGTVMGESDQCIGDTYLTYRVHELIKQGLLQYQGELMPLRRLEIGLK